MWQELLMASRRQPAAADEGAPEEEEQQQPQDVGLRNNVDTRTDCGIGTDEKTMHVENAALAAVRSVLLKWKTEEQQKLPQQQQQNVYARAVPVACPAVANSVSNMQGVGEASGAVASEGVHTRAAAAAVGSCTHTQEHFPGHALQQQPFQETQQQRTPAQQEQFLSSLQRLLRLLQEQQKTQGQKQQEPQRSDVGWEEQQPPLLTEPRISLPKAAAAAVERATAAALEQSRAAAAGGATYGIPAKSNKDLPFTAGREVLQQLLSTSAPLSYPETYAFLQSIVRRQQQQQREQEQLLPQQAPLGPKSLGVGGEEGQLHDPWLSRTGKSSCLSAATPARAAEQQRRQQREDTRNRCSNLNPALLLLGSPSPRYFPKRPRGSSSNSWPRSSSNSWRSSGRRSLEDKDARSRNTAAEEEQLYQEWLDHVHGVYIERFDDTDQYRDDFDPGYRILDIPEAEYINDCNRLKQNPIQLVGGRAACSKRPSPPPFDAPSATSRLQVLSNSTSRKSTPGTSPAGRSFAVVAGAASSSISSSGGGPTAAASSGDDGHFGVPPDGARRPAAAGAPTGTTPLQTAAAPTEGDYEASLCSASRGSSPCFGSTETTRALAAAAAPLPSAAVEIAGAAAGVAPGAGGTAEGVSVAAEQQDGRSSPFWGSRSGGDCGATGAAETGCNWPAECPVAQNSGSSSSLDTSRSSSFMQSSNSSLQRNNDREDEVKGEPSSRQNSLLTSGSTTTKNTSIPERESAGPECGRGVPTEDAADGEHSLKGSVSVEDELADCKVQLAPPSSVSPHLPAGSPSAPVPVVVTPPALPSGCGGASLLDAKQQQQQQRRRCGEQEASSAAAAADALLQEYTEEMRRAAAWRECYCDGDAALFRQKQEQSRYMIESCCCSCNCCGRAERTDAAECIPGAFGRAVADELLATAGTADAAVGAGGGNFAWSLRGSAREVVPLHASSGDAFYPVRVAGSEILGFPRQQHELHQREKLCQEQHLWPRKEEKQLTFLGCPALAGSAAPVDAPSTQLLRQSQSSVLQQHAAPVDQRVACCGSSSSSAGELKEAVGSFVATHIDQISAATAAAEVRTDRRSSTCSSNRSLNRNSSEGFTSVKHSQMHESDMMAGTSTSSRSLGQIQERDTGHSCCSCSCGCSACCSFKSNNNGSISTGSRLPNSVVFDCFHLKIVFERGKTGFEDHRELVLPVDTLFAGRYLVQQEVGRAAFSRCLRCIDTAAKQPVCLKIIKNEKEYMDQSLDEVKTLRYLQANGDPDLFHYVQLLDCFYHREHLVLVTELLSHNLYHFSSSLKKMKLPSFWTLGRVQRVARELLLALNFVHKLHVIHCDLKPENVLLRPSFLSDLATYKDLAGKHPLTIIREVAQEAAAAQPAGGGGGDGGERASVGEDGVPPKAGETLTISLEGPAGAGGRLRTAQLDAAGGAEEEKATATGVGGGGGVSGENVRTHLAAAQLYRSVQSSSDSRRTQDAVSGQQTAAAGTALVEENAYTGSNRRKDSCVVQQSGEAEQERFSLTSGMLQQQQDCYERPKKQQYLQQRPLTRADLYAGESCVQLQQQQQQVDELLMQQHPVGQVCQRPQTDPACPWPSVEKDSVSQLGPRVGSGCTESRETVAPTAGPTAASRTTHLPPPTCCGNSSVSPSALPAATAGAHCSGLLQRLEQERAAAAAAERLRGDGCTTQGSLRDFAAAAAAAAAAENLSVKLIDFGNSCRTSDALIAYVQSRSYRAPEVLLELPYGSKIDIWSLGCVLFELFTGVVLFMNEGVHSLLARIVGIIGQLPWYMVHSSPKRHALFDADGYLYTVIQTNPSFPASAPPALSTAGGGVTAPLGAVADAAAAGVNGRASVDRDVGAVVAAAARGRADAEFEKDTQAQPQGLRGASVAASGGERLSSNSSSTCHSTGSCCDNSRGCLSRMPDQQQQHQQQGHGGEWDGSNRAQGPAGVARDKVAAGATAESGREKRIYERASQDSSGCEEPQGSPTVAAAAPREGEQRAAVEEAGTTAGGVESGPPCFGGGGVAQQECSGTGAAVTAATATGARVPAAEGLPKPVTKNTEEGGRIFRFLLPKPSSLRQRLRVDDNLFIDFLERMLKIDPVERWSAERLLGHPFLQKGLYADGL